MSSVPILPARLDWPSTVGNFLLNFGTLEYFTFVFLKDHLSEEEFLKVRKSHLKDRTARIALYLKEAGYQPEQQTAFADLCVRLDPIRELRNHIAHGHMLVRFDGVPPKPLVTMFKAKDLDMGLMPGAEHLEYEELLSALSTLTELIEAFQDLAGFKAEGA